MSVADAVCSKGHGSIPRLGTNQWTCDAELVGGTGLLNRIASTSCVQISPFSDLTIWKARGISPSTAALRLQVNG